MDGLAEMLAELRGKSVKVLAPKKGPRAELVQMARDNASHAFREKARASEDVRAARARCKARLRLPALPRRIECVDVSHTGGTRHGGVDRRARGGASPTASATAAST